MWRTGGRVIGLACSSIAQIVAHAAGESLLCHDGWQCGSSGMT